MKDLVANWKTLTPDDVDASLFTEEKATKIAQTLQMSKNIFSTVKGDLYRVATIIDPSFHDKIAVSIYAEDDKRDLQPDELYAGLFRVMPKRQTD